MAKKKIQVEPSVSGIDNTDLHQSVMAELLVGIRKAVENKETVWRVSTEQSIRMLTPYENYREQGFTRNHNYDLIVKNRSQHIHFVLEIENDSINPATVKKVTNTMDNMKTAEEAFIVFIREDRTVAFNRYYRKGRNYYGDTSSFSSFLGIDLLPIVMKGIENSL